MKANLDALSVSYSGAELEVWARRWPSHGLRDLRGSWIAFDASGDLVDLGPHAYRNDCAAFAAFTEDCACFLAVKLSEVAEKLRLSGRITGALAAEVARDRFMLGRPDREDAVTEAGF